MKRIRMCVGPRLIIYILLTNHNNTCASEVDRNDPSSSCFSTIRVVVQAERAQYWLVGEGGKC